MDLLQIAVSALVGAFVLWIATNFVVPQVAAILTKAPKLRSEWNYFDGEGGPIVGTAKLKQNGTSVSVTANRTASRDGQPTNRTFKYKGEVAGRTVVFRYVQEGSGNAVLGSIVLRLDSDLLSMSGFTAYYSDTAGRVITNPVTYRAT